MVTRSAFTNWSAPSGRKRIGQPKVNAPSVDPAPPLVMSNEQVGRISAWGMKRSM
jgi:hypothetical protein